MTPRPVRPGSPFKQHSRKPKTQNESDCKKDCDKELVKAAEAILGDIYYTPSAKENYLTGMIRDWFSK